MDQTLFSPSMSTFCPDPRNAWSSCPADFEDALWFPRDMVCVVCAEPRSSGELLQILRGCGPQDMFWCA